MHMTDLYNPFILNCVVDMVKIYGTVVNTVYGTVIKLLYQIHDIIVLTRSKSLDLDRTIEMELNSQH
jgi:hypothetical protein